MILAYHMMIGFHLQLRYSLADLANKHLITPLKYSQLHSLHRALFLYLKRNSLLGVDSDYI
jgi:hypothetical protein